MRLVHRIAPTGHFLADLLLEDDAPLPADAIADHPPEGLQWPQWDGAAWADASVPFTVDAHGVPQLPQE